MQYACKIFEFSTSKNSILESLLAFFQGQFLIQTNFNSCMKYHAHEYYHKSHNWMIMRALNILT